MLDNTVTLIIPGWLYGLIIWSILASVLSEQFKEPKTIKDSITQIILALPLVIVGLPFWIIECIYKYFRKKS
jgi:hypothetical protein